jgi:hypothetical protein
MRHIRDLQASSNPPVFWKPEKGFITMPERAGIGVEMNEEGAKRAQFQARRGSSLRQAGLGEEAEFVLPSSFLVVTALAILRAASAVAQPGVLTPDLLIPSPDWKGERFTDGGRECPFVAPQMFNPTGNRSIRSWR